MCSIVYKIMLKGEIRRFF